MYNINLLCSKMTARPKPDFLAVEAVEQHEQIFWVRHYIHAPTTQQQCLCAITYTIQQRINVLFQHVEDKLYTFKKH